MHKAPPMPLEVKRSLVLCCGRDTMSKYYPGSKKCYVPPLCVPTETDEDIMFHLLAELDNVATCSSRRNNTKKVTVQPRLDQLQAEPLTNFSRLTGDEPWTSRVVLGASRALSGRGRTRMILVHRARAGRIRGHQSSCESKSKKCSLLWFEQEFASNLSLGTLSSRHGWTNSGNFVQFGNAM